VASYFNHSVFNYFKPIAMQKNQNQGQPNETGRNPQQRQDVQNETHNKPEVENPQPNRKVEEPITGSDRGKMDVGSEKNQQNQTTMQGGSGSGNTGGASNSGNAAGGSSNKDYQRSDAGFQGGNRENEDRDDMSSSREKTAQSDKGSSSNR